tara:strand:- start:528 stop:863 length:336 start_codon:yes stop_codon:yes gene_type:complete
MKLFNSLKLKIVQVFNNYIIKTTIVQSLKALNYFYLDKIIILDSKLDTILYQLECLRNEINGLDKETIKNNNSANVLHSQFQNITGKIDDIICRRIVYKKPNYFENKTEGE